MDSGGGPEVMGKPPVSSPATYSRCELQLITQPSPTRTFAPKRNSAPSWLNTKAVVSTRTGPIHNLSRTWPAKLIRCP